MKYLNFTIIVLLVLSSCVFSGSPKVQVNDVTLDHPPITHLGQLGDSITVDTVIGDFRLFYKINEVVDTTLSAFSCDEEESVEEFYKADKIVLLNIQKLDTTCVLSYEQIDILSFLPIVPTVERDNYYIDAFYLKEVTDVSVVFSAKLCMFGKEICKNVDVIVHEDGTMKYILIN